MKRVWTRLLAITVLLASAVFVAVPAQAASLPVLIATSGNAAHTCARITESGTSDWVGVCADILTGTYTSSANGPSYQATGRVEVWCNNSAGVIPCLQISITGAGLYRQSNTSWAGDNNLCINNCSQSSVGRSYFTENWLGYPDATWEPICRDDVNGYTAVWAITGSIIVYDSDGWTISGTGPETGHYFVCEN